MYLGIRLFVAYRGPASDPEPNGLNRPQRRLPDSAQRRDPCEWSPVRIRRGPSPKTPRIGGYFAAGSRVGRAVSAPADYMAERAVDREPVSLPKSLIRRENTGNSPETGFRGGQILSFRPLLGVLPGVFP